MKYIVTTKTTQLFETTYTVEANSMKEAVENYGDGEFYDEEYLDTIDEEVIKVELYED